MIRALLTEVDLGVRGAAEKVCSPRAPPRVRRTHDPRGVEVLLNRLVIASWEGSVIDGGRVLR